MGYSLYSDGSSSSKIRLAMTSWSASESCLASEESLLEYFGHKLSVKKNVCENLASCTMALGREVEIGQAYTLRNILSPLYFPCSVWLNSNLLKVFTRWTVIGRFFMSK